MKEIDQQYLRSPWLRDYSNAAYAAQSVVRLIDRELTFGSPKVQRLFHARSGMALNHFSGKEQNQKLLTL